MFTFVIILVSHKTPTWLTFVSPNPHRFSLNKSHLIVQFTLECIYAHQLKIVWLPNIKDGPRQQTIKSVTFPISYHYWKSFVHKICNFNLHKAKEAILSNYHTRQQSCALILPHSTHITILLLSYLKFF